MLLFQNSIADSYLSRCGKLASLDVSGLEREILKDLATKGGTGNIMEQLPITFDFDKAFEFANNLQNKDFVKLLYSNFNKKLIVVELTLLGFKEGK